MAGRRVRLRRPRKAAASRGASRSCAHDATDNGYARPDRGPHRPLRPGSQRGHRGDRPRRRAAAAESRELLRRGPAALAHRPEADRDHATRRPELHGRRQPRAVAEVAVPRRVRSVRRPGAAPDRLRRRRPRAPDPAPRRRSARWSCRTATRATARLEERVRRGRVGPRPHDAVAHARLRLRRRDPLLRRDARERAGRAVGHRERDLHARRGLRDPLEARRPVRAGAARCAAAGASSSASSRPSATTSTASSGTSTSTATSSSRSSSPASSRRWRSSRVRSRSSQRSSRDGVAAPHHQHLFNARLDFDVDGRVNEIARGRSRSAAARTRQPVGERVPASKRRASTGVGRRNATIDAATSRAWRISNPDVSNGLGQPVAYKLVPTMSTPTLLAHPDSPVGRRAGFAQHNLWVTPYARDERRAAGEYPNQHAGGDGLPAWTAADRSIAGTDLVCWYTFGVTHFVRPEDWPVMPVEYSRIPAHAASASSTATPRSICRTERCTTASRLIGGRHAWAQWTSRGTASGARPLRRDRDGGRAHRRLAAVGRPVHRGRRVRRASLRHASHGREAIHDVDLQDDGASGRTPR